MEDIKGLVTDELRQIGLSDKAIEYVASAAGEGLDAEGDLDDEGRAKVTEKARALARQMQAEATRWVQRAARNKPVPTATEPSDNPRASEYTIDGAAAAAASAQAPATAGTAAVGTPDGGVAALLRRLDERLTAFEAAQKEREQTERNAARRSEILAKARALGLPEGVAAKLSIPPTADVDKELGEVMQQLVNGRLAPKQGAAAMDDEQGLKAAAKAWAATLPDRK